MAGPSVNVDPFRRPVQEVTALLPDRRVVDRVLHDLRSAELDVSGVRVLHGDDGVRILDPTGAEHGWAAQIARFFQNMGYTENIQLGGVGRHDRAGNCGKAVGRSTWKRGA